MSKMFDDLKSFESKSGNQYYMVEFCKPNAILCWQERQSHGGHECNLVKLHVDAVDPETLEGLGIWAKLSDDIRSAIEEAEQDQKQQVHEKMDKARKSRRKKYADLPTEMVCACGYKTTANWSYLNQKADKLGVPAMDLFKNYKCQKCNPTKGRGRKKK